MASRRGEQSAGLAAVRRIVALTRHVDTPLGLADAVLRILKQALDFDRAAILLLDPQSGELQPIARSEWAAPDMEPAGRANRAASEGIPEWVVRTGRSIRQSNGRREGLPANGDAATGSQLCVPLLAGEQVTGVIYVESNEVSAFSELDQQLLEASAGQLGLALENGRLASRLHELLAESEKLPLALAQEIDRLRAEIDAARSAAAGLKESEALYRSLVERLPAIIYRAERVGARRMLYVSPRVEQVLGYPYKEWTRGTNLWQASLHPEDRERVLAAIHASQKSNPGPMSLEYRLVGRDGRVRWFRDDAEAITDDAETRPYVQGLMLDVTESKEIEAAIQEHNRELLALNAALSAQNEELNAFSHTVAHDLKNPLSVLQGFAEFLSGEYTETEDLNLRLGLDAICENARRINIIINELLLLAEVRQVEEIPPRPLDMGALVEETVQRLHNLIAEYQAEIIVAKEWPTAIGHAPWVAEIWVNYLSNAIKYGGRPPRAELGADQSPDGGVRFWVRDNGKGLTAEEQQRLFTPFTQLHHSQAVGHGLGLSIVQRIAAKLGGAVGVESAPGKGSLFWFTLPAAG
jgi:PAS domain S-box-containing protein